MPCMHAHLSSLTPRTTHDTTHSAYSACSNFSASYKAVLSCAGHRAEAGRGG